MKLSISALLTVLTMAPQAFQVADQVVKSVEAAAADVPGISGSQKLAAAEAQFNAILSAIITDANVIASLVAMAVPLINGAVAKFNALNLFGHKAAAGQPVAIG